MSDVAEHRPSSWRTKRTGESRSRAESQANKFSPARMLFVGPNSAPNSGQIVPIETLAAPGVRIHPASPPSLRFEAFSRDDRKKPACRGDAPAPPAPEKAHMSSHTASLRLSLC